MVINTNIPSAYASRVLSNSSNNLAKSLAKLSSGSRITSPEDDAAGLAQSMKFGAEIKRIGAARSNVGNASSFSSTQDGFLSKIDTALRRMSELATMAADGTKSADDVGNYNKEFQELKAFVNASATKSFNSVNLFSVTLDDTSIKAPNATEPVISESVSLVVPVVGIDALGCRLAEDNVFRPEIVSRLTGLSPGGTISVDTIATLITHPQGIIKGSPAHARIIPLINKVDLVQDLSSAEDVASKILEKGHPQIKRVILGQVQLTEPVVRVVLATGIGT